MPSGKLRNLSKKDTYIKHKNPFDLHTLTE